jgi:hypothetical protein
LIQEEKKRAQAANDVQYLADLNKVEGLLRTGGGILRTENPYTEFIAKCVLSTSGTKPKTLGEVQRNLQACAAKWSALSEEEKKRLRKERVELYNLP